MNEEKLIQAFKQARYVPSLGLGNEVWNAIILRQNKINRLKMWAFSSLGVLSLCALIPALQMLMSDFSQSGFSEYVSLAFGGSGSIASYWKELSISIAESLPAVSIALSLGLLFIFFLSVRSFMKYIVRGKMSLSY